MSLCQHLQHSKYQPPTTDVCDECIKLGDSWVHLRTCLTCGNVGCCDSSKNKHATKHFHHTKHPVIASAQPRERWLWCYLDEQMAE
jgi:uncharacterized UBP type Zn finger protein